MQEHSASLQQMTGLSRWYVGDESQRSADWDSEKKMEQKSAWVKRQAWHRTTTRVFQHERTTALCCDRPCAIASKPSTLIHRVPHLVNPLPELCALEVAFHLDGREARRARGGLAKLDAVCGGLAVSEFRNLFHLDGRRQLPKRLRIQRVCT
jgi:hypothetical protein